MNYSPRILCKVIFVLITSSVLVAPSCGPSSDDSGNSSSKVSANTSMLEGIWDGAFDSPDFEYAALAEIEFLPSGQALYFLLDGKDLWSLDPLATMQCYVSSSLAVNLNVQYSFYDDSIGGLVFVEFEMVGTMDPAGDSLDLDGTLTAIGPDSTDIFHAYSSAIKRPDNDSVNTWMLEGVWDGAIDYSDYGYTSLTAIDFLFSGEAFYFFQDGVDLFLVDPLATVQCHVSSSFAVNFNARYNFYNELGELISCTVEIVGVMEPTGNSLIGSGTRTFTTASGVFSSETISASFTNLSSSVNDSFNTSMLEGVWDGTVDYSDGYTSILEGEFLPSGQALYFLSDGEDVLLVDPLATVQCDVSSSLIANLDVEYSYEDEITGFVILVESELVGRMDPTGNNLVFSGTITVTDSGFIETIAAYATLTERSSVLRGDGDGPGHNPWHGDDLLSTERSDSLTSDSDGSRYLWSRN